MRKSLRYKCFINYCSFDWEVVQIMRSIGLLVVEKVVPFVCSLFTQDVFLCEVKVVKLVCFTCT